MLLSTSLVTVVWDVELHELVQASESVAERGVFNPFFVSDYEVVKRFEAGNRVNHEVPVARNGTDRICEQSYVHYLGERHQRLQVLPLRYVVVVQVEELQACHACEYVGWWKCFYLILRQIDFLKVFKRMQEL